MILRLHNSEGDKATIDSEDYELVSGYKWGLMTQVRDGYTLKYVTASHHGKTVYLHRVITNCPRGKLVDHLNGDGLDNRRSNLKICTHSENQLNRKRGRTPFGGRKY